MTPAELITLRQRLVTWQRLKAEAEAAIRQWEPDRDYATEQIAELERAIAEGEKGS